MGYKWDCDTILMHIRRRVERGRSISPSDIRRDNPNLFYAAKYHFGSCTRAVNTALGSGDGSGDPKWDKGLVLNALSERYRNGEDLSYTAMRSTVLMRQARKHFGNWRAAIEAAGIPYVEISRYGWGVARKHGNG